MVFWSHYRSLQTLPKTYLWALWKRKFAGKLLTPTLHSRGPGEEKKKNTWALIDPYGTGRICTVEQK